MVLGTRGDTALMWIAQPPERNSPRSSVKMKDGKEIRLGFCGSDFGGGISAERLPKGTKYFFLGSL